jgi:hypothetical protein
MRGRIRTLVLVLAGLGLLGCDQVSKVSKIQIGDDPADLARKRVEFILKTLQSGPSGTSDAMQKAINSWEKDGVIMERDEASAAVDAFDQWRQDAGIYEGLSSFEIDPEVRYGAPQDPPETFYVQVKVNGSSRWLRVPKRARISWVS